MVLRLDVYMFTHHLVKNAVPGESDLLHVERSPEDRVLTSTPGDSTAFGDMHCGNTEVAIKYHIRCQFNTYYFENFLRVSHHDNCLE